MSALAIHLGVNRCAPRSFRVGPRSLARAEHDARALAAMTTRAGLTATTLLGEDATRPRLLAALADAAAAPPGSLVVLTFSGHGAQLRDVAPDARRPRPATARNRHVGDEPDGLDELWCLHDGVMLDDELSQLLAGFARGVRVLVITDACHSGSMLDGGDDDARPPAQRHCEIAASVIHFGACADDEVTYDSVFVDAIAATWADGQFAGGHRAFLASVAAAIADRQVPVFSTIGPPDPVFEAQRPFTP